MKAVKGISSIIFLLAVGIFYWYAEYRPQPFAIANMIKTVESTSTSQFASPPTTILTNVTFEVDGTPYTIPQSGNFLVNVDISAGSHTITREGKTLGTIDVGWFDGKSVINLDLEPLIVVDTVYATDEAAYKAAYDKLEKNTITVNGKSYTGPYRLIEPALYTKKSWDYSPAERSPDEVKVKFGNSKVKKELMRATQFEREFD